ncbi:UNVERIFIED_CONTAM: NADH-ubiquinone oxidoreductase chain 2 [Sesamum calycinum]|uniref:NADH-ubiquinone oxidoreductase chain 2 n=1 Tax=Sesamum calycinum TaxID=2727403 RepID=A0AAW2KMM7_9LAMI
MGLGFRKDEDAKGKETLNNQPDIRILARAHLENGDSRTGKSGTRHLLNNTKNKAILCPPREKLVMIAMNAALEDVYKKEEFQPLLPLGRVSLLSELAGRGDQLINMNLESGWLIAASLSWRLSGRGGACYRNLFSGRCSEWSNFSSPLVATKFLVISKGEGRSPLISFIQCLRRSLLAYVVVGLPTRMRPPECLLGSGRSQADTYDRRRKDPHFIAPGERKFDRGLERWKKRLGMDLGVFVRAVCGENRTYGFLFKITAVPFRAAVGRTAAYRKAPSFCHPLAYWDSTGFACPLQDSGSARESAGNNRKEGVHVAAAPAPFLVNGAQQVRHLLQKRESTSDNHASARQRVEWPRADLFGYIIQVESRVTGTAV